MELAEVLCFEFLALDGVALGSIDVFLVFFPVDNVTGRSASSSSSSIKSGSVYNQRRQHNNILLLVRCMQLSVKVKNNNV